MLTITVAFTSEKVGCMGCPVVQEMTYHDGEGAHAWCACVCVLSLGWGGVGLPGDELVFRKAFFSFCCSRTPVGLPLQDSGNLSTGMWTIELMAKINRAHISQQGSASSLFIPISSSQPRLAMHFYYFQPATHLGCSTNGPLLKPV